MRVAITAWVRLLVAGAAVGCLGCGDETTGSGTGGTPTDDAGGTTAESDASATLDFGGTAEVGGADIGAEDALPGDDATPDSGGVDGGGGGAPSCAAYCGAVQAACGDAGAATSQYADEAACLAYCQTWGKLPLGAADDTAGNSVGCRTYHAGVASTTEPATHCPHAGPSGGGACGSWCENYCHLAMTNCTGDNALYATAGECVSACQGLTDAGTPGDTAGDSLQCRIYHLGVAGSEGATSAALHCPHGGLDGGGVCVDPAPELSCDGYCQVVTKWCTGEDQQYASKAECVAYCESWAKLPLGTLDDTAGNTIGCRIYHALAAKAGPAATHCPHAGPSGGGVCGTWCTNYCHLAETNCTGDLALYADGDACTAACSLLEDGASPGDVSGDSVQCRIYHLGVAGSDGATSAAVHCPHGAPDGGDVCVPPPSCETYCDAVMAACGADAPTAQYGSAAECLAVCASTLAATPGTHADTSGNTLGCRIYHAGLAATDAEAAVAHCPHAGPSGGDVCGTWCENYCDRAEAACADDLALYPDRAACLSACAAVPDAGPEAWLQTSGDTVQCRLYHLQVAASAPPASAATHCPHAGLFGGGVCEDAAPACETYCHYAQAACTGASAQYATEDACQEYCGAWGKLPSGQPGESSGNTVACRTYHAKAALLGDAGTHCPHAGPSGGNVCGSWCTNMCHLAAVNCTGEQAVFASDDACTEACALASDQGLPGDTTGDSVQCRIYHLGVAGSDGDTSAAIHCPHGAPDGGGVCTGAVSAFGDTCEKPLQVTALPYSYSGDTTLLADDVQLSGGCGVTGEHGKDRDAVFMFVPATTGPYDITLVSASGPQTVYVVTDCADTSGSCVGSSGDLGLGGATPWTVTLTAGTSYFVVVDAWLSNESGAFTLTIDTGCAAECTGKSCGDDGCGGSCGTCGATETCTADGQCAADAAPPTYDADAKPIFAQHCAGGQCHGPGTSGGHAIADTYASALQASYYCAGKTVGECTVVRIQDGSMPLGAPGSVPADQIATLQAWIAGGMLEK